MHSVPQMIGVGVNQIQATLLKQRDETGQMLGQIDVVAVEAGNVLASRRADRRVARAGWASIFLPDVDQPLAVAPDRLFERLGIRRAIIYQHYFKVWIRLCEHGIQRTPNTPRRLRRRNDDAHQRLLPLVQDATLSPERFSMP